MHRSYRHSGFTLIELLVVIAIIAILAAILFPVFAQVREKARQATCASNQKQIALAFLGYVQDYDETYPPNEYGVSNTPSQTYWQFLVDPYIKSGVADGATGPSKNQLKSVFFCPDFLAVTADGSPAIRNEAKTRGLLSYGVNDYVCPDLESGKTFQAPATLGKIDEPASLVLLAESLGDLSYSQGRDDASGGYNDATTSGTNFHDAAYMNARRRHSGGANYAFTDGHVKWFKAPGDTLGPNYNGGGYTGQDRSYTIAWVKCNAGLESNPVGYFYPLNGPMTQGQTGNWKFQGGGFPADACP